MVEISSHTELIKKAKVAILKHKLIIIMGIVIIIPTYLVVNQYRYRTEIHNADIELRLNNPPGFLNRLNEALKINPTGSSDLFRMRAIYLFQNKKYKESIRDYKEALSLGLDEPSAYFNMGIAYSAIEKYAEAINAYDESLRLGSKALAAIYFNKGLSYLELEDYEKAEKNFALYVEQKPGDSDGYIMRAKSLFASGPGKYNDALQHLNKAISLEEDYVNISAYELRSKIRNKRGDFSGAISDLSAIINSSKSSEKAEYYVKRSLIFMSNEEFAKAISDLNLAISINKEQPYLYGLRSLVFFSLKDYASSMADIDKAISLKGDWAGYHAQRAKILIEDEVLSDPELTESRRLQAVKAYDTAIKLDPEDSDYFKGRGRANFLLERYEKSISDYTKAIELSEKDYGLYSLRGLVYLSAGKRSQACSDLRIAKSNKFEGAVKAFDSFCKNQDTVTTTTTRRDNTISDIYWLRGVKMQKEGDNKGAIEQLGFALDADPENIRALNSRSIAKAAIGDMSGALADSDRAIEIEPKDFLLHFQKGRVLIDLELYAKASDSFSKALELNPTHIQSLVYGGIALRRFGDILSACSHWEKALNLGSEDASEFIEAACN